MVRNLLEINRRADGSRLRQGDAVKIVFATILAALLAAVSGGAAGSTITYSFTVTATSGPLLGDSSTGTFSFDSSTVPIGGGVVGGTDLLTSLSFSWDGIA
jgi:hypothetical protein